MSLRATVRLLLLLIVSVSSSWAEERLKIGVSTSLSGYASTYGFDIRDTLLFANDEFGGGRYELIFEDDRCNPKDAVSAANKLVTIDKVDYVIGYGCSGAALAAAPILERAKKVTMVVLASSHKIADAGEHIFRTFPSDRGAAAVLYDFVAKHHRRIGVISAETDYPQDLLLNFKETGEKGDLEIVSESYLPDTRDFRTILLRLRQAGVEGIFANGQAEEDTLAILRQAADLQWSPARYAAYYPSSEAFLKLAGPLAEGVIFVDTPPLDAILNGEGKELYGRFKKRFPPMRSIQATFATALEGFRALDSAIRSGGDPRAHLLKTSFQGVFGSYSFDGDGEVQGISFAMRQIRGGQVAPAP